MPRTEARPNVGHPTDQRFTETRWSLVFRAGQSDSADGSAALEHLCRTYWPPIYGFLRRQGHGPADAQDLTQEFFAGLLRRNAFAVASEERGRFRTFLLCSLQNFLRDHWSKSAAAKRGGGAALLALDSEEAERRYLETPAKDLGPEQIFDRRWAMTLLEAAIGRLRAEHVAVGKLALYERLQQFLTAQPGTGEYESAAADLGMKPGTVAVAVHRLRQRCRELLREELAQTVANPSDAEAEFRSLFG